MRRALDKLFFMHPINFDTLKYAKQLQAAGMDHRVAEEQAMALSELMENALHPLATKSDLQLLEQRMVIKLGTLMVACVGAVTALLKLF